MKQRKFWKKFIIIFTCLTIVTGGALSYYLIDNQVQNPSEWESFSSNDERFQAQFPKDPEETSKEISINDKTLEYHELSTEEKDASYSVSYVDFPGIWKIIGAKKILSKTLNGILEQEEKIEALLHQEISSHEGLPALNYRLKQDGKEVHGRLVVAGNTLYRVVVSHPLAAAEKVKPQAFLDSFSINT